MFDEKEFKKENKPPQGQKYQHQHRPNHNEGGHQPQQQPAAKTRQDDQQYKRQEDKGDAKRNKGWAALVRVSAFCAAILGMFISAQFSVDGFSITVDSRAWVGWCIAIILIVIQSAWQRFGENLTIFILAMVCYIYGITTNVIGIVNGRGGFSDVWDIVVPIIFGIMLEVFPEPFLAWAISGDISSDPLKKFVDRWS